MSRVGQGLNWLGLDSVIDLTLTLRCLQRAHLLSPSSARPRSMSGTGEARRGKTTSSLSVLPVTGLLVPYAIDGRHCGRLTSQ